MSRYVAVSSLPEEELTAVCYLNVIINMSMTFAFPLSIILNILASLIFLVYWIAAFIILYHLTRFGIGVQPKKFAAIFLFGSVVLSGTAIILFMNLDLNSLIPR